MKRLFFTTALYILSLQAQSQNVGIGITSPQVPLHIKSTTYSDVLRVEGLTPKISFWNVGTPDGGGSLWAKTTGMDISSHLPLSGTALPVTISPGNATTATFLQNGNVGIGIAVPISKLEVMNPVKSTIRISSTNYTDSSSLVLSNRTLFGAGTDFILSSNQETGLNISTASDFASNVNPSVLFLKPQGNVGIGTLTPIQKIDLNGRMNITDGVIQRGGAAITTTSDLGLYSRVPGNFIRLVTNAAPIQFFSDDNIGTTPNMVIESNGNVGIGNTNPLNKLDVNGNMNISGALKVGGSSGTSGQVLVSNGAAPATWQNSALSNNTRFSVTMTSVSAGSGNMPFTTRYNLNPANVTIGANSITINQAGLYHFEVHLASYVFVASPTSSPYYGISLNTAFVGYELRRNRNIPPSSTGFYGDDMDFSIDLYLNAFQTLTLPYTFFAGGGTTNSLDGWFTGYLISN